MTDKAIRSKWGIPEDESLTRALARSRVAPDYTMGAVTKQTGVPADTIRSWERRYGFPVPHRTGTNRRQYSERDMVAVTWLRDQTAAGQGISEAVSMLLANLPQDVEDASPPSKPAPVSQIDSPFDTLLDSLHDGHLTDAQSQWDSMVVSLSPDAVGQLILDLAYQLTRRELSFSQERAFAFLLRKAQVLLDFSGPDQGRSTFCILTSGTMQSRIQATVLAADIARQGHLVITPFLDDSSLTTIDTIQNIEPDGIIILDAGNRSTGSLQKLLSGIPTHHWRSNAKPGEILKFLQSIPHSHHHQEP